jgi:hypothetical protein
MGVTPFTFILLPLCLLWMTSPDKLLQLTAIVACFEAAAALVIGNSGLQPGLVPASMFMGYVALQLLLGARYRGLSAVSRVVFPFVVVTLYAMLSSYLLPRLFRDQAWIWPQKPIAPWVMAVLSPETNDFHQDFYLLINCLFLVLTAIYLTKSRRPLSMFVGAYFLSGYVVAAVSAWQFANRGFGIPFPETLFYSNPDWAILDAQEIGAVPRINGPLAEPAALAAYMASIVCATGWLLLRGRRDKNLWILFFSGLLTMMLSTSTTGFGVLTIVGVGVPLYALVTRSRRMMAAVTRVGLALVIFGGLALPMVGTFVPRVYENISEVIDATLNKPDSTSYDERVNVDIASLQTMMDTYGFGAGWGSNRSSSLMPGVLGTVGIPGLLMILWFIYRVAGAVRMARRIGCSSEQGMVIDACVGGLVGFLLAALISGPTITSTAFYLLLALLIACATRVRLEAGAGAAAMWRRPRAQPNIGPPHAEPARTGALMPEHGLGPFNAVS